MSRVNGEGEASAMVRMRLWVMRRLRIRYVLVIGIFLAVVLVVKTWVSNLDKESAPDYDLSPADDKTLLRRGPKMKDNLKFAHVNDKREAKIVSHPRKMKIHSGEQVLRDNDLGDAFRIPTTLISTKATKRTTPKPFRKHPVETKDPAGSVADHERPDKSATSSIKESFGQHSNLVIDKENSNDNVKQIKKNSKPVDELSPRMRDADKDLEVDDIGGEDVKALRFPKTKPPWLKTMRPLKPEEYVKNCSQGSVPIQSASFHTKKFCLVDDPHEYFGLYDKQLCYHRGTDKHKTRIRIKKHKVCECYPGWYGKYCSMPDVVFHGGYPYEYGVEIHNPPRRLMLAFPFNGEFAMLETVVRTLHNAVDVFLILESNYTAAGEPKERELLKKLQDRYLPELQYKLVYISLDYFPRKAYSDGWVIDALLRNHIGEVAFGSVLENVRDDDIIVSTDADEVMTEETLMFLKLHEGYPEPFGFIMKHSVFGYFWQAPDITTNSYGGCSVALFKDVLHGKLYDLRNGPKNVARDDKVLKKFKRKTGVRVKPWSFGTKTYPAGWHCSWCFLPAGIRKKLISAHASDFPRWGTFADKTNLPFITKLVRNGTWFDEKTQLKYIFNPYETFYAPRYIKDNEHKLGYLLDHSVYMKMSQHYINPKVTAQEIGNDDNKHR